MTDAELLTKLKAGLGITGTFQDNTLTVYIDEAKEFMKSAGVYPSVIASEASAGCIMRGVADLWNYGSGNATLSDYFCKRVLQLKKARTVTITAADGTVVSVIRYGVSLTSGAVVNVGETLKIEVTGGTVTVNGEAFTSGNTIKVSENLSIISTASGV